MFTDGEAIFINVLT